MAVAASRREVLVPQLAEGDDLSDGLGMGPLLDRELVPERLTEDDDMALSLAADEKLTLLTSGLHGAEGLVRFICVRNALRELIPELQGAVQGGRDELVFVDASDACDVVLMGRGGLEVALTDNHILVHIGFHLLRGGFPLGFFS